MITAILEVSVLCDSYDRGIDCHGDIDFEVDLVEGNLTQERYYDLLAEADWLVLDDMAWCPVCRFQLHD